MPDPSSEEAFDPATLCPWQTGGSYLTPPEYCDLDKDPDAEFCPLHEEKARLLAQFEPDFELSE